MLQLNIENKSVFKYSINFFIWLYFYKICICGLLFDWISNIL